MRRLLVILPLLFLAACGDDDPDVADTIPDDTTSEGVGDDDGGDALGDNPSREDCINAMVRVLESLEVPDGVDPNDGLDDTERPLADAAIEEAYGSEGIDLDDADHPCIELTADMTDAEFEELTKGVDADVLVLLGAQATVEFDETGTAIEN